MLISNSVDSRDIAGRLAARTRFPLAVDAVGLTGDDVGVVAHHSVFGGSYYVDSAATFGPLVVTVRQGAIDARAEALPLVSETLTVAASGKPAAVVESFESRVVASSRPELKGAAKVVSGGRGVGSAENFALVEQLAGTLGAAVGASRAAVDAGISRTSTRSGRPGYQSRPNYMSHSVSPELSSTAGACRRRRRSWRSTKTLTRPLRRR